MTTITTVLPLSLDSMKQIITTPDVKVVVDYAKSTLKGRTALIYLTNASIPVSSFNMTDVDDEQIFELIDAYITHKSTLKVQSLLAAVALILFKAKGIVLFPSVMPSFTTTSLISPDKLDAYFANEDRAKHVTNLVDVLDNVLTFAITCSTGFKESVGDISTVAPLVNDINYTGFTYVNLLEQDLFVVNYFSVHPTHSPKYFSQQYDEYMYGGRNLFSYVANTFMLSAMDMYLSNPDNVRLLMDALAQSEAFSTET